MSIFLSYLFIHVKPFFLTFLCFPKYCQRYKKDDTIKSETLSLKTIANRIDFLNKAVIIQWNIRKKDLQLFATKFTEKIPDFCNAKERYQWFLGKKNTKSVKQ